MTDDPRLIEVRELIERSSLGTPDARRYRQATPPSVRREILAGVARHGAQIDGEAGSTGTDPGASYFYLSHERDSATGLAEPAVAELFRLLCSYLRELDADFDRDDRDASVPVIPGRLAGVPHGDGILREVATSLVGCRVFVPLLSAKYVTNELTRHELEMVKRRDDIARRRVPFGLSAIVPVLWDGADDIVLPVWASDLVLEDDSLGPEYRDLGLRGLRELDRARYHQVVFRIANTIRRLAAALPPLPGPETAEN